VTTEYWIDVLKDLVKALVIALVVYVAASIGGVLQANWQFVFTIVGLLLLTVVGSAFWTLFAVKHPGAYWTIFVVAGLVVGAALIWAPDVGAWLLFVWSLI
jgi:hypothetical protein